MSEEQNPIGEEETTVADTPEATPATPPATPLTIVETPAASAPADVALPSVTPVAAPPLPAGPPPSAPAQAAADNSGPREFSGEHEGGGRGRRTSVDVRPEEVNYKNVPLLSRFIDPRGRILSRRKTRVSAKVQRSVVKAIKLARHLALLPYTADQSRIVRRRR